MQMLVSICLCTQCSLHSLERQEGKFSQKCSRLNRSQRLGDSPSTAARITASKARLSKHLFVNIVFSRVTEIYLGEI